MLKQVKNVSVILIRQCIFAYKENLYILDTYIYAHSERCVFGTEWETSWNWHKSSIRLKKFQSVKESF